MSINFSTLKGLTITEGNVTQIADASGRVLWKQAPKSVTVILRPTADIENSQNNNHSVYPAESSRFACIDEEVADGDATYIYGNSCTTEFMLTGTIPDGMTVTAAKFICVAKFKNGADTALINVILLIDSVESGIRGASVLDFSSENYAQVSGEWTDERVIAAINTLGTGNISVPTSFMSTILSSSKSANVYVTQYYIELTCEG